MLMKPHRKPLCSNFSSGPCAKYPTFDLESFDTALLGRSHRSKEAKKRIKEVIDKTRSLLNVPDDYLVGIVPGSDTGAIEMAMWNLVGKIGVDCLVFDSFGKSWMLDIKEQLKIEDITIHQVDFGQLPDLTKVNFDHDVIFTWNGTTSGVKIPNGDWIPDTREGLVIADATSAVFAMDIPWNKVDVVTFSWQKVLGGEAAHGILILSPRAVERLEEYTPAWPIPKILQLKGKKGFKKEIFEESPINTVSMLCIEDYKEALMWAESIGGLSGLKERSQKNFGLIKDFVDAHEWIDFLAESDEICSNTSVCLTINLSKEKVQEMVKILSEEQVAFDCSSYREAPSGLRIWCGATVNSEDIACLLEWINWAYEFICSK